jgi:FtsP/CotA-like multicopper oxidase with cupredoxin domain
VTQGNEPVPDAGTINGVGQWNGSTTYSNYSLLPETTYRLRLINSGSFAAMRFSIDGHPLTVVEADGTSVVPYQVGAVVIDVAQRYSVLFTTGASGAYWIRATVQQDSFTVRPSSFSRRKMD